MAYSNKDALTAAAHAMRQRHALSLLSQSPVSPVDAAERLGFEVRFVDISSMEGMYVTDGKPKILLNSDRPLGRRNFTCAHEMGHHFLSHGTRIDEILEGRQSGSARDSKEVAADVFAANFIMPRPAVLSGMRQWTASDGTLSAENAYCLASWLGVGYTTLLGHLQFGLGLISLETRKSLAKFQPKTIRARLLGSPTPTALHVVTRAWTTHAVDCEIGDHILLPLGTTFEGAGLRSRGEKNNMRLVEATSPGIARAFIPFGYALTIIWKPP